MGANEPHPRSGVPRNLVQCGQPHPSTVQHVAGRVHYSMELLLDIDHQLCIVRCAKLLLPCQQLLLQGKNNALR